jgi:hypothetical protein
MIINRRTYHIVPGKFRPALSLIKQIREITRMEFCRDFKILTPLYGAFGTIVLEFEYADSAELEQFTSQWYPFLEGGGWIVKWFELVQDGVNELWTDSRETELFSSNHKS